MTTVLILAKNTKIHFESVGAAELTGSLQL